LGTSATVSDILAEGAQIVGSESTASQKGMNPLVNIGSFLLYFSKLAHQIY